jgi:hypothetical protein
MVKRPGRGADHPFPPTAEVKERVELYLYSPSGHFWPVLWRNLLYFNNNNNNNNNNFLTLYPSEP